MLWVDAFAQIPPKYFRWNVTSKCPNRQTLSLILQNALRPSRSREVNVKSIRFQATNMLRNMKDCMSLPNILYQAVPETDYWNRQYVLFFPWTVSLSNQNQSQTGVVSGQFAYRLLPRFSTINLSQYYSYRPWIWILSLQETFGSSTASLQLLELAGFMQIQSDSGDTTLAFPALWQRIQPSTEHPNWFRSEGNLLKMPSLQGCELLWVSLSCLLMFAQVHSSQTERHFGNRVASFVILFMICVFCPIPLKTNAAREY